jgi:hypothetical protein
MSGAVSREVAGRTALESATVLKAHPLIVLADDDNHSVMASGPFIATLWRKETRAEDVVKLGSELDKRARAYGRSIGAFMVVEENAPLPSSAARRAMAESLTRAAVAFLAVLFEGNGFRAAAVRGVVTGVSLLSPPPYPYKAFGKLEEAAAWAGLKARGAGLSQLTPLVVAQVVSTLRGSPHPR